MARRFQPTTIFIYPVAQGIVKEPGPTGVNQKVAFAALQHHDFRWFHSLRRLPRFVSLAD
jgi:hypothetical protein